MAWNDWNPTRGRIIAVPVDEGERVVDGGIIIPKYEAADDLGADGAQLVCRVFKIGPPPFYVNRHGVPKFEIPWTFKVGDLILREKHAGYRLYDDSMRRVAVVLRDDQIISVLEEGSKETFT